MASATFAFLPKIEFYNQYISDFLGKNDNSYVGCFSTKFDKEGVWDQLEETWTTSLRGIRRTVMAGYSEEVKKGLVFNDFFVKTNVLKTEGLLMPFWAREETHFD